MSLWFLPRDPALEIALGVSLMRLAGTTPKSTSSGLSMQVSCHVGMQGDELSSPRKRLQERKARCSGTLEEIALALPLFYLLCVVICLLCHIGVAIRSFSISYLLACVWYCSMCFSTAFIRGTFHSACTIVRYRRSICRSQVAWVKVGAIRQWHRFPRRQELGEGEFVQGVPTGLTHKGLTEVATLVLIISASPYFFISFLPPLKQQCNDLARQLAWHINCLGFLVYLLCVYWHKLFVGATVNAYVVSHCWLAQEHPDPSGVQLQELLDELERLEVHDNDLLFYDFCSLPQWDKQHSDFKKYGEKLPPDHPARRTPDQEKAFKECLSIMHLLYTWQEANVIVLPSVPATAKSSNAYEDRGWTCFELAVSSLFARVCNEDHDDVLRVLNALELPKKSIGDFDSEFATKAFTEDGDRDVVKQMYKELHRCRLDFLREIEWLVSAFLGRKVFQASFSRVPLSLRCSCIPVDLAHNLILLLHHAMAAYGPDAIACLFKFHTASCADHFKQNLSWREFATCTADCSMPN